MTDPTKPDATEPHDDLPGEVASPAGGHGAEPDLPGASVPPLLPRGPRVPLPRATRPAAPVHRPSSASLVPVPPLPPPAVGPPPLPIPEAVATEALVVDEVLVDLSPVGVAVTVAMAEEVVEEVAVAVDREAVEGAVVEPLVTDTSLPAVEAFHTVDEALAHPAVASGTADAGPPSVAPSLDGLDDLGDALELEPEEALDVGPAAYDTGAPALGAVGAGTDPAAPLEPSRFADIVLGDEELDAIFQDLDAGAGQTQPSIAPGSPEASAEPVANGGAEITLEPSGARGPALEIHPSTAPSMAPVSPAPAARVDSSSDADADAELVIEGDEEEIVLEVDAPPAPDRGAILAATVTSRKRGDEGGDRMFAADARAEAEARAALLVDEAGHATAASEGAALLALAADLVDGALGDRARARTLAESARAQDPECLMATRVLRRIALAEGDFTAALALCSGEADGALGDGEREALGMLAGELAAPREPAAADTWWTGVAHGSGVTGALAQLFAGAARHDPGRVGEALAALAERTSGLLAAATDVTRARLAEGAAENDTALSAVRDAVQRDPTDAGGWLAMLRIGLSRAAASVFREALAGLAAAGAGGSVAVAAEALGRALDGVLGDPVGPGAVEDAGVAGWLVAHAQRDAGGDSDAQVTFGAARAEGPSRAAWAAWTGDGAETEAGRYHALRRAATARREADVAAAAAALAAAGGAVGAGLQAHVGGVDASEVEALGDAGGAVLRAALAAAAGGALPEVEAASGDPFRQVAVTESAARQGRRDEARASFAALADGANDTPLGVVAYAARRAAALGDDDGSYVQALRTEALLSGDPARAAALRLVAGALSAPLESGGGASDALEAARSLPGDLAAAELAGLYALRAEIPADVAADLFDAAAGDGADAAQRMAAVRAALRRAAVDGDAAAVAIWRAWRRHDADAALGVLVLRAPGGDPERVVAVLRAQAERAAQSPSGGAGVAVGMLLAVSLAEAGRHAEAVQAVARARTLALRDPGLEAAEERVWLGAGMFAEVAERAFDQLKAAPDDGHRIAAYEKLAELDRTHRGDVASSVLSYQAILELAPGHMASLRTLERYFLEQGRHEELLAIYDRLVRHAQDPSDAVAAGHAAARLASTQAEGDPAAGDEFLRAAFARGAPDRRLLSALDADARWTGDLARFAEVHRQAESLLADGQEMERATHACRAGEAYAALGEHDQALAAFERAAADAPRSPVALAGLARERETAGDAAGAAAALESLGGTLKSQEHAVAATLRAADLWSMAAEPSRALVALRQALARDPRQTEALARVLDLLRQSGDEARELEFLDAHTTAAAATGETGGLPALHQRAAELAEGIGDRTRARAHWRALSRIVPDHDAALRALARLSVDAQDWTPAADAMIRLARVTANPVERVELFFALGEIFDRRLPDPRRAEAAYRRALQLAPEDPRTLSRLSDLYARIDAPDREAEVLSVLVPLMAAGPERVALQLRLARALDEGAGDAVKAEAALEAARREAPTDLAVLRAFARFYERQGANASLYVLLDRAAAEVRREIDRDPTNVGLLEHLADVLTMRGRRDGTRMVAAVSVALGATSDALRVLAPQGTVPGAEAAALTPAALDLLAPPAVTPALREVLARTADVLERVLPFNPAPLRAERLGARPHPLRNEIERWARLAGLPAIEIYLAGQLPGLCLPVGRSPAAVAIPTNATPTQAMRFAVARGVLLAALALPLAVRAAPRELALVMSALLRQFDPMYRAEGVDAGQLDDLARKVSRALPRERHADIAPFAYEVLGQGIDAEAIQAGALELGDRVALLATGDVAGALAALTPEGMAPARAVEEVVLVGRLARVALSDRFLEARHIAGADKLGFEGG